ncbi:transmembrane emp24 domain-containing protein 5-like [Elysia marginata]|uniref:Transmembrane emp24 domain-containing protein 5-like n=1 Tax=Elysia marginata TaxID=1093978 RepID=A0AAV4F905_9GAST|nr:transmembrane emp24 domain-containing protein 5-like [Elysia marginata]
MANHFEIVTANIRNFGFQSTQSRQWNRSTRTSPGQCLVVCWCWAVLLALTTSVAGEIVLGEENEDFDFDGLPGVQHDFKVFVHAGMEECFFQRLVQGAQLHTRFEVLKGGNKQVDFYIRDGSGEVVQQVTGSEGFLTYENVTGGEHSLSFLPANPSPLVHFLDTTSTTNFI